MFLFCVHAYSHSTGFICPGMSVSPQLYWASTTLTGPPNLSRPHLNGKLQVQEAQQCGNTLSVLLWNSIISLQTYLLYSISVTGFTLWIFTGPFFFISSWKPCACQVKCLQKQIPTGALFSFCVVPQHKLKSYFWYPYPLKPGVE